MPRIDPAAELETQQMNPFIVTARLNVFAFHVKPTHLLETKWVYLAWRTDQECAYPVATCTVFEAESLGGVYVEWLDVSEQHRRQGIATELMLALDAKCGGKLIYEGATEAGDVLIARLERIAP